MLEIGWKSFGNHLEVFENRSTPSVIFGHRREIFVSLRKLSEIFGDLQKSSEIFGNLWKPLVNLQKFRCCKGKSLTHFTEKSGQVYKVRM